MSRGDPAGPRVEQCPERPMGDFSLPPPKTEMEGGGRNAIEVYDQGDQWEPYRETGLLAAHEIMMRGLMDSPGQYRTGGVGVMGGEEVIHVAPPADRVPILMSNLFDWLNRGERHPLVASSMFHYEFELSHPFADGNGRIGRLWQTMILARWNAVFAITPGESMVYARQQEYYEAIGKSTKMSDAAPFVEFMLEAIFGAMESIASDQATDQVTDQVKRLLRFMDETFTSTAEMMAGLSLSNRPTFRKNYLHPSLDLGFLEMKYPDNPQHPGQRYRLTAKGRRMKALLGEQ